MGPSPFNKRGVDLPFPSRRGGGTEKEKEFMRRGSLFPSRRKKKAPQKRDPLRSETHREGLPHPITFLIQKETQKQREKDKIYNSNLEIEKLPRKGFFNNRKSRPSLHEKKKKKNRRGGGHFFFFEALSRLGNLFCDRGKRKGGSKNKQTQQTTKRR